MLKLIGTKNVLINGGYMNKKKILVVLTAMIISLFSVFVTVDAATKVKLTKKSVAMYEGDSIFLKVKGTKSKIKWSSKNKKVAVVTKKGKVKAKKPGKTTITAKVGKKKYKCKVIVKRKNSIKVTKPSDNNNSVINQVTTKSEPSQIVTTKAEVKTTKTERLRKMTVLQLSLQ